MMMRAASRWMLVLCAAPRRNRHGQNEESCGDERCAREQMMHRW
jgi:hypothetical protein